MIAAPEPERGVVAIPQDVQILATSLESRRRLDYVVERGRHVWLHVAQGELVVNGTTLKAGDAVATSRPTKLHLEGMKKSDALLFDLG